MVPSIRLDVHFFFGTVFGFSTFLGGEIDFGPLSLLIAALGSLPGVVRRIRWHIEARAIRRPDSLRDETEFDLPSSPPELLATEFEDEAHPPPETYGGPGSLVHYGLKLLLLRHDSMETITEGPR